MCLRQLGVQSFLDVADVRPAPEIPVDEIIHVPELEFDGGADIVEADNFREIVDDFQAAFQLAPMVVRHLEDKQFIKKIAVNHKR